MDRTGKALIKATKTYAHENPRRTWWLFGTTIAVALIFAILALELDAIALRVAASLALGLTLVRLFIFYHDCMHRAVFRRSPIGRAIMAFFGLVILTPPRVWRDSHNYHHQHTSKLVGSSIGSYPLATVRMYRASSLAKRLRYRVARHWLTMLFGYITMFAWGMCVMNLATQPRRYWDAGVSLLVHAALVAILLAVGGFELCFFALLLPMFTCCAVGAYLFYAQHTFPGMQLRDRREWEYTTAALVSSSMMKMNPVLRWFTGSIGYHHVHHVNAAIPFYRLEEAMTGVPELAVPVVTTLRPKDICACLRLHLWNSECGRMMSYREALACGFTSFESTRTPRRA